VACNKEGHLIVAQNDEVKLMGSQGDLSLFSNYPLSQSDKVYLNINQPDLLFLLEHSDLKEKNLLVDFYTHVLDNYDGQRLLVPYVEGLLAVQHLLKACVDKYQKSENFSNHLDKVEQGGKAPESKDESKTSHTEVQMLMHIALALED
jgi:hypothetical protein